MFLDEAKICLQAGRGGDGIISFRREKYRPKGGPDGGNGGRGGDVILRADSSVNTLLKFKNKVHFKAQDGGRGGSNDKHGKDGQDLIISVPVGTLIKDLKTDALLADLSQSGDECMLARGGEGGKGNAHFKSSTWQAPRICERGAPGEERWIKLELKLLADVGIIGMPNVGKSTLISKISAARPKIAPYPFTTLEPHLGVVRVDEFSEFVAVDIPGLIEGAHEGRGLGDRFLKHIERTKLLIHLIDISGLEGRDPLEDFHKINHELGEYSQQLTKKPQIVAGNKIDLVDEAHIRKTSEHFAREGIKIMPISAVTGAGLNELVKSCYRKLKELASLQVSKSASATERVRRVYTFKDTNDFEVSVDGKGFIVTGGLAEKLGRLVLGDDAALEYFYKRLQEAGIMAELQKRGLKEGDRVRIGSQEFEYRS